MALVCVTGSCCSGRLSWRCAPRGSKRTSGRRRSSTMSAPMCRCAAVPPSCRLRSSMCNSIVLFAAGYTSVDMAADVPVAAHRAAESLRTTYAEVRASEWRCAARKSTRSTLCPASVALHWPSDSPRCIRRCASSSGLCRRRALAADWADALTELLGESNIKATAPLTHSTRAERPSAVPLGCSDCARMRFGSQAANIAQTRQQPIRPIR